MNPRIPDGPRNRDVLAGRFELLESLGTGGMGTVFKARDLKLDDEVVAVKLLLGDLHPSAESRFRAEIRLARRITHRNVCKIFEYGEDGPARFIVMEYVKGETLRTAAVNGRLPLERAVEAIAQAADGLAAIHEAGIVHRDIKTVNLMLTADALVKVMDFGIAKEIGSEATAFLVGTPAYMSPEQAAMKTLDGRSDLYSLGVVLYEIVVGERPFQGDTPTILAKHASERPPLDTLAAQRIPPRVRLLLEELLAKAPDDRPRLSTEVVARLRASLTPVATTVPPTTASPIAPAAKALPSAARMPASPPPASARRWAAWPWLAATGLAFAVTAGALTAWNSKWPSVPATGPSAGTSRPMSPISSPTAAPRLRPGTRPSNRGPTPNRAPVAPARSPVLGGHELRTTGGSAEDLAAASRAADIQQHVAEARRLFALREYAAAVEACDKAVELDPSSRTARDLRAQILEAQRLLRHD